MSEGYLDLFTKFNEEKSGGGFVNFAKFAPGKSHILFVSDLVPGNRLLGIDDVEIPLAVPYKIYTVPPKMLSEQERKSGRYQYGRTYSYPEGVMDEIDPRFLEYHDEEGTLWKANPDKFFYTLTAYIFNLTAWGALQKVEEGQKLTNPVEKAYQRLYGADEYFTGVFRYDTHVAVRERIHAYIQEQAAEGKNPTLLGDTWEINKVGGDRVTYVADPVKPVEELPEDLRSQIVEIVTEAKLPPIEDIIDEMRYRPDDALPEKYKFPPKAEGESKVGRVEEEDDTLGEFPYDGEEETEGDTSREPRKNLNW